MCPDHKGTFPLGSPKELSIMFFKVDVFVVVSQLYRSSIDQLQDVLVVISQLYSSSIDQLQKS